MMSRHLVLTRWASSTVVMSTWHRIISSSSMVDSTVVRAGISSPSGVILGREAGWLQRAALAMAAFLALKDFFLVMDGDEAVLVLVLVLVLGEGCSVAGRVQETRGSMIERVLSASQWP